MWPDYFPSQCPPADARNDELNVYRLVADSQPTINDFLPTIVEMPHRKFSGESLCLACGVSVFKDISDVLKKRSQYKPLKEKLIAQGTITHDDGLIMETGAPTHVTWWVKTQSPHASFVEVKPDATDE